jgi:hypothetical protein
MWRFIRADGRLADLTNLTRAKDAVLAAAEREIRYANRTPKPEQLGTVFAAASSPVRQNLAEACS